MNKERMICVKDRFPTYEATYEGTYVSIEPAPPKDWWPECFDYSEPVEGCVQIPFIDKPECKKCPYRNLE